MLIEREREINLAMMMEGWSKSVMSIIVLQLYRSTQIWSAHSFCLQPLLLLSKSSTLSSHPFLLSPTSATYLTTLHMVAFAAVYSTTLIWNGCVSIKIVVLQNNPWRILSDKGKFGLQIMCHVYLCWISRHTISRIFNLYWHDIWNHDHNCGIEY